MSITKELTYLLSIGDVDSEIDVPEAPGPDLPDQAVLASHDKLGAGGGGEEGEPMAARWELLQPSTITIGWETLVQFFGNLGPKQNPPPG